MKEEGWFCQPRFYEDQVALRQQIIVFLPATFACNVQNEIYEIIKTSLHLYTIHYMLKIWKIKSPNEDTVCTNECSEELSIADYREMADVLLQENREVK